MNARKLARQALNGLLAPIGLKVVRLGAPETNNVKDFIPLDEVLAAAKRAALSVGDYIDTVMANAPGSTQRTIDEMTALGVFGAPVKTVLEIGPGSGRYLEKTIAACSPSRYEIYETSKEWAGYLAAQYKVVAQETDGRTLKATPDKSVDLIQAHKVFSTIPFLLTCSYWSEMVRVAKGAAYIVFDAMTDNCLDRNTVAIWIETEAGHGSYPAAMPRGVVIDFFTGRGFDLVGTFLVPMAPGTTECFVFRGNEN